MQQQFPQLLAEAGTLWVLNRKEFGKPGGCPPDPVDLGAPPHIGTCMKKGALTQETISASKVPSPLIGQLLGRGTKT